MEYTRLAVPAATLILLFDTVIPDPVSMDVDASVNCWTDPDLYAEDANDAVPTASYISPGVPPPPPPPVGWSIQMTSVLVAFFAGI